MLNSNRTLSNEVTLEDLQENKYYKLKKPITLQNPQESWLQYQIVQEELNLLIRDYHRLVDINDTQLTFEYLPTDEDVSVEPLVNPNEQASANTRKNVRDFIEIDLQGLPDGEATIFLKRIGRNLGANKEKSANQEGGARKKSAKYRKLKAKKSRKLRKSK